MTCNRLALVLTVLALLCQASFAQTKFPPAWVNTATYAPGDLVTDYGNIYRCEVAVTKPYLDPSKTYQSWEMFYVRSNTTILIGVGQAFPDLATAWKYVQNARIAEAAYLHLNIVTTGGVFNQSFTAPFSLDHASGSQISIIGDNASNINLDFTTSNGFTIDTNHSLGSLSHFSMLGSTNFTGISASTGASIANLDHIGITGFNTAVSASSSSNLTFGADITITSPSFYGCAATNNASISFPSQELTCSGTSGTLASLYAATGGQISAEGASLTNSFYEADAEWGGNIDVTNASISNSLGAGCWCQDSTILAVSCTFSNNEVDLQCEYQGMINAFRDNTTNYLTSSGGNVYF
jgi:hypothetical protein